MTSDEWEELLDNLLEEAENFNAYWKDFSYLPNNKYRSEYDNKMSVIMSNVRQIIFETEESKKLYFEHNIDDESLYKKTEFLGSVYSFTAILEMKLRNQV